MGWYRDTRNIAKVNKEKCLHVLVINQVDFYSGEKTVFCYEIIEMPYVLFMDIFVL